MSTRNPNLRIMPDSNGTFAIYMTGETQPIQTALTREQAEAWIATPFSWGF